jgi:hypothetical protein
LASDSVEQPSMRVDLLRVLLLEDENDLDRHLCRETSGIPLRPQETGSRDHSPGCEGRPSAAARAVASSRLTAVWCTVS